MKRLNTTLEQWRAVDAVVRDGGFAQAAASLNKSQSSVSHAVRELSDRLDVELFEIVGRKAELTTAGVTLLRHARRLLEQAAALEDTAQALAKGVDVEIAIAIDAIVPTDLVIDALNIFAASSPQTRVTIRETVLSGTIDALTDGEVDFALTAFVPANYIGTPLLDVDFIAVAVPHHPLHVLDRELDFDDLRQHRQLVLRDSGRAGTDAGWLGADQRWTFSSPASSLEALRAGSGFAWMPARRISADLASGRLRPLRLGPATTRSTKVQIVAEKSFTGGTSADLLVQAFLKAAGELPDCPPDGAEIAK
jgi:DNA-binding transcriptional LysR family regulator